MTIELKDYWIVQCAQKRKVKAIKIESDWLVLTEHNTWDVRLYADEDMHPTENAANKQIKKEAQCWMEYNNRKILECHEEIVRLQKIIHEETY